MVLRRFIIRRHLRCRPLVVKKRLIPILGIATEVKNVLLRESLLFLLTRADNSHCLHVASQPIDGVSYRMRASLTPMHGSGGPPRTGGHLTNALTLQRRKPA